MRGGGTAALACASSVGTSWSSGSSGIVGLRGTNLHFLMACHQFDGKFAVILRTNAVRRVLGDRESVSRSFPEADVLSYLGLKHLRPEALSHKLHHVLCVAGARNAAGNHTGNLQLGIQPSLNSLNGSQKLTNRRIGQNTRFDGHQHPIRGCQGRND